MPATKSGAGMRRRDNDMMNRTADEAISESRKIGKENREEAKDGHNSQKQIPMA